MPNHRMLLEAVSHRHGVWPRYYERIKRQNDSPKTWVPVQEERVPKVVEIELRLLTPNLLLTVLNGERHYT